MKGKLIVIVIFFGFFSSMSAATLIAPFPAIAESGVNVDFRYNFFQKKHFEIYSDLGVNVGWSLVPIFAVPSASINAGINGSLFFKKNLNGLNLRLGTGLFLYLNPFFYRDEFYEMDCLLASNTDLSINYRFKLNNNCYVEPYLGGRVSFFGSLISFYGIKPFISFFSGVTFSINY